MFSTAYLPYSAREKSNSKELPGATTKNPSENKLLLNTFYVPNQPSKVDTIAQVEYAEVQRGEVTSPRSLRLVPETGSNPGPRCFSWFPNSTLKPLAALQSYLL